MVSFVDHAQTWSGSPQDNGQKRRLNMQSPGTDSIASITGQQLVYGAEEGSTTEVNISVIVCTRNRGSVLDQCLQRFAWMEVPPGLSWEIVVVDNNSTDNTESVVRGFAERSGLDVRYVCERKPGGSHAHNAGIAAARGKILAFTDDDCMVDKGWMGAVAKEFESDPGLAGIGGRVRFLISGISPSPSPRAKRGTCCLYRMSL